jgi:nitrite reductase/ring-hydroxylating ferredoxin subunit/uncharacterized membrane protein
VRQSLVKLGRRILPARRDPSTAEAAGGADDPKPLAARRPPFLRLAAFAERVERAPSLDGAVNTLSNAVAGALPPGTWLDDTLHGVPFGQPAHPALVRLPLGCWTSAVLLDFLPLGTRRLAASHYLPAIDRLAGTRHLPSLDRLPPLDRFPASPALIGVGIAASLPSAATGLADWSALHRHQQRVGLVHAIAQGTATALFSASLLARLGGQARTGKALSLAGLTAATVGSYLGGHLALRLGAGASHAESVQHLAALGWQDLCPLADLPDGHPARRQLGYLSLLALRQGDVVHVLSDHCAHLGGPLHQGRVITEQDATCIICPWHGSVFRVSDGGVVHGPATARQPSLESRVTDGGWVQVRPRSPRPESGLADRPGGPATLPVLHLQRDPEAARQVRLGEHLVDRPGRQH